MLLNFKVKFSLMFCSELLFLISHSVTQTIHASSLVWCCYGDWLFLHQTDLWELRPKVQPWSHQIIFIFQHFAWDYWGTGGMFLFDSCFVTDGVLPTYMMMYCCHVERGMEIRYYCIPLGSLLSLFLFLITVVPHVLVVDAMPWSSSSILLRL